VASLKDLEQALRAADAAGAAEDARRLAAEIERMRATQAQSSQGARLKLGPLDTGIGLPGGMTEFLAGMGRRMVDIGTLGNREAAPEAERALDESGAALAGGISADLLALLGGGAALRGAASVPQLASLAARSPVVADILSGARTVGSAMMAPKTVKGAAAAGATYAGATTSGGPAERAKAATTGAIAGAAVPALVKGGRVVASIFRPMTDQGQEVIVGNALREMAGSNVDDAINRLADPEIIVPFSRPTMAQASGSPGLATVERALGPSLPGGEYGKRLIEQNIARLNVLRDIAGDAGKRELFERMRDTAADELYGIAFKTGVDPKALTPSLKGQVTQLLKRDHMQAAMREARRKASNEGINLTDKTSIEGLHFAKRAIDDMISAAKRAGKNDEARQLLATQQKLLGVMDDLSPAYAEARKTFAEMSKPIARMDVGTELLKKLEPALSQEAAPARTNAAMFARAMREADETARKATGFAGARMEQIMTEPEMYQLNAVLRDLQRANFAQEANRAVGSPTFQNLATSGVLHELGVQHLPNLLSRPVQVLNYIANAAYKRANEQMRNRLMETILRPEEGARLMQAAGLTLAPGLPSTVAQYAALPLSAVTRSLVESGQ
jgi:hypothetical protein